MRLASAAPTKQRENRDIPAARPGVAEEGQQLRVLVQYHNELLEPPTALSANTGTNTSAAAIASCTTSVQATARSQQGKCKKPLRQCRPRRRSW
jgi:hypothetical protein